MGARSSPATKAAERAGVPIVVHEYRHRQDAESLGLMVADALGVDPARVHKTLVVSVDERSPAERGDALALAVVPVAARLDLKAVAAALGARRAEMADPAVAARATGYVTGGISPLGGRRRLRTVVDDGAGDHATILVSGGRRGLEIEIAPEDLVRVTEAVVASIARH